MTVALVLVFVLSFGLVVYGFVGYPLLLAAIVRLRGERPVRRGDILPSVSLVISAYNEATVIRTKLTNALALDYPEELLEICVGDLLDVTALDVHHGDVRRGVASILLAPGRRQISVERDERPVLIDHAGACDAHAERSCGAAFDRLQVERGSPRVRAALRRHHDPFAVGRPGERLIIARVPRQLLGFSSR